MKKKYIAILLGITLGMTTLVGCSGTNTSESSTIQESQSVTGATENSDKRVSEAETADVYGEVTAVSEDSITIKVGTMKQMENRMMQEHRGTLPMHRVPMTRQILTVQKKDLKTQTAVKINQIIVLTVEMHSRRKIWKNRTETDRVHHPCWI